MEGKMIVICFSFIDYQKLYFIRDQFFDDSKKKSVIFGIFCLGNSVFKILEQVTVIKVEWRGYRLSVEDY